MFGGFEVVLSSLLFERKTDRSLNVLGNVLFEVICQRIGDYESLARGL